MKPHCKGGLAAAGRQFPPVNRCLLQKLKRVRAAAGRPAPSTAETTFQVPRPCGARCLGTATWPWNPTALPVAPTRAWLKLCSGLSGVWPNPAQFRLKPWI